MSSTLFPIVGTGPIEAVGLHGFSQTGGMWREVAQKAGIGMVVPDLPGHGSAWPGAAAWSDAVAAGVAVLGTEPRVLIGYSQGGRVALGVAATAPASIRRLVLVSTHPGYPDGATRSQRRAEDEALAQAIEEGGIDAFLDDWLARPMFEGLLGRGEGWRERDRLMRSVNTPEGLAAALRGYGAGSMPYLGDAAAQLPMPVSVVVGERDERFKLVGEELVGRIPNAELIVVPGAGHNVVAEAPEVIADLVRRR